MPGLLLLILLFLPAVQAQEPPAAAPDTIIADGGLLGANSRDYAQLISKLDQFNRKLGGCPKDGHLETCYAPSGTMDAKLWKEIRGLAAKVFHLAVPRE